MDVDGSICDQPPADKRRGNRYKHGEGSHTGNRAEYRVWAGMKARCGNPRSAFYSRYGGRGIRVCERWLNYTAFLSDMGRRPSPQHSLDRIDNDGPYSPENCRWATSLEQASNRSGSLMFQYEGERLCLAEICRRFGAPYLMVYMRIKKLGWPLGRALSQKSRLRHHE